MQSLKGRAGRSIHVDIATRFFYVFSSIKINLKIKLDKISFIVYIDFRGQGYIMKPQKFISPEMDTLPEAIPLSNILDRSSLSGDILFNGGVA